MGAAVLLKSMESLHRHMILKCSWQVIWHGMAMPYRKVEAAIHGIGKAPVQSPMLHVPAPSSPPGP